MGLSPVNSLNDGGGDVGVPTFFAKTGGDHFHMRRITIYDPLPAFKFQIHMVPPLLCEDLQARN